MSRPFLIEDEPFLLSSVMRLHTMEQATKQRQRIAGVLEAFEFQEPDRFAVQMAIEEALVNAVKHGNGCDPTKVVTFRCRITPALFRVEITDQGSGLRSAMMERMASEPTCSPELILSRAVFFGGAWVMSTSGSSALAATASSAARVSSSGGSNGVLNGVSAPPKPAKWTPWSVRMRPWQEMP